MRSTRLNSFLILCSILAVTVGCGGTKEPGIGRAPEPEYDRPLGPGELALRKIPPEQYPDFSQAYHQRSGLEQAARYNLEYLSKASSQRFFPYLDITHERAVMSNETFIEVLQTTNSPEDFDRQIKSRFEVYESRGWNDKGDVLFTGYYRPIFDARLQPDNEFRYPLYRKPPGGGQNLTRSQIDKGALAGQGLELCYLRDRFEAYIVTVQGSGKLRLADGSFFEIGYAGDNGLEYQSVGQSLVESGAIQPGELSLQGLIRYFKEHPDQLDRAFAINSRYVYFTPRTGGPYGSLNVPVTPFRTIATDKQVYPRASVAFMQTQLPARGADGQIQNYKYDGFAMDQDTGGAIRAAGRCDVFMGTGPEVGELAGRTFAEGRLYYIFVRPHGSMAETVASPPPNAAPPVPQPASTGQ